MINQPKVIFEDNHLLVIAKPSGWLSQGDRTGDPSIVDWVKNFLKEKYSKPGNVFVGLPHRLDRPVSGVMVLAKTSKSLERLNKMFRDDQVIKIYDALVTGMPHEKQGKLKNILSKNSASNTSFVVKSKKEGGKEAELDYVWQRKIKEFNLLEVKPKTGRPHQIRVQLADIRCPIVGDTKYGGKSIKEIHGVIGLHAKKLDFYHPIRKEHIFFEVPNSFNSIFAKIVDK